MTQITVNYQRNRWIDGDQKGSDQHALAITFDTPISADCERELMSRIQQAQRFVKEAVLRQAVPPSDTLKRFREKLPSFNTPEKLEAALSYVSKLFAEGTVDRREANIMDEEIYEALMLLAAAQVTLPTGDGTDGEIRRDAGI